MSDANGAIVRVFTLDSYRDRGQQLSITTDASVWGFGAVLCVDGIPRHSISDCISPDDEDIFKYRTGDPKGQQTWECLAMLIALCGWRDWWMRDSVQLHIQGDNLGMLSLVA